MCVYMHVYLDTYILPDELENQRKNRLFIKLIFKDYMQRSPNILIFSRYLIWIIALLFQTFNALFFFNIPYSRVPNMVIPSSPGDWKPNANQTHPKTNLPPPGRWEPPPEPPARPQQRYTGPGHKGSCVPH